MPWIGTKFIIDEIVLYFIKYLVNTPKNTMGHAIIATYSSKTELERFFPNPGGYAFVQNSIYYQKFPIEIFHKSA